MYILLLFEITCFILYACENKLISKNENFVIIISHFFAIEWNITNSMTRMNLQKEISSTSHSLTSDN